MKELAEFQMYQDNVIIESMSQEDTEEDKEDNALLKDGKKDVGVHSIELYIVPDMKATGLIVDSNLKTGNVPHK